ncbi:hypothetical protein C4569_03915 [Candidatus Parcubacteria bacterium]|nr:MAG: hypothetical protein C4569_03915 [Candidatus Parcubacteria bacterium]
MAKVNNWGNDKMNEEKRQQRSYEHLIRKKRRMPERTLRKEASVMPTNERFVPGLQSQQQQHSPIKPQQ